MGLLLLPTKAAGLSTRFAVWKGLLGTRPGPAEHEATLAANSAYPGTLEHLAKVVLGTRVGEPAAGTPCAGNQGVRWVSRRKSGQRNGTVVDVKHPFHSADRAPSVRS